MSHLSQQNTIEIIIDNLAKQGYAITPNFLNNGEVKALATHAKALQNSGEMHKARTGQPNNTSQGIRGDFIYWIEESQANNAEAAYLSSMAELQQAINQSFFLGLFEFESHFAIYPAGAGYQKHLDQFIGKEERKVSCILYLNEHWQSEYGGQLRIYLDKKDEACFIDIDPQAGTLVTFLSSDFLHEVLPAKKERMSITGWFRTRVLDN